jgi:hypothetical protein
VYWLFRIPICSPMFSGIVVISPATGRSSVEPIVERVERAPVEVPGFAQVETVQYVEVRGRQLDRGRRGRACPGARLSHACMT